MSGLFKEDSGRIGFVISSLFAGALDLDELQKWAIGVLAREQDPPLYLVDLAEFNDAIYKIYKVIGFVPHWPHPADQKDALIGIAYKRGRVLGDSPLSREQALQKLVNCPHIEAAFRTEFPFVNL